MKYEEKHTFYAYLNPICAAIGIMGFLLYLEIDYTFRSRRHCEFESFIGIAGINTIKCKLNKLILPLPIVHISVTSNIVDSC